MLTNQQSDPQDKPFWKRWWNTSKNYKLTMRVKNCFWAVEKSFGELWETETGNTSPNFENAIKSRYVYLKKFFEPELLQDDPDFKCLSVAICSEDALWKTPIYRFADDTDRMELVKLILERSSKDKTLKAAYATLEKWIDSISANTQSEDE